MRAVVALINKGFDVLDAIKRVDFIAPLAFRIYLAPIFIIAGLHKIEHFQDIAAWFGNPDWGLGLPAPELMAALAAGSEFFGGFLLLAGFATRLIVIPLMFTMVVAALTAHWDNGWFAIASGNGDTSIARFFAWLGFSGAEQSLQNADEIAQRVSAAKSLLKEYGNYTWLTEKGGFVVLNNGIEFAATYFIMLLSLFFTGAGKWLSVDYWLAKYYRD